MPSEAENGHPEGLSRLYRLVPTPTPSDPGVHCRCGTKLEGQATCYRFARVPEVLIGTLDGERFCGIPCARALILETLELIDGASARTWLRGADETRIALRYLLVGIAVQ